MKKYCSRETVIDSKTQYFNQILYSLDGLERVYWIGFNQVRVIPEAR
jgi:hypothetical protein